MKTVLRLVTILAIALLKKLGCANPRGENPNVANTILVDILNGIAPTSTNSSFITQSFLYNKNIRPSGIIDKNNNIDYNGALIVSLLLSIRQIISLDEKNQILTTASYLYLSWGDPRLSWNDSNSKYGYFQSITTGASNFWMPDIAVMNAAGTSQFIAIPPNQNIVITSDGKTYLTLFLSGLPTRCKLNVYRYPFDKQNCSIIIGAWMGNTNEINFEVSSNFLDTSNYIQHPIWLLKEYSVNSIVGSSRFSQLDGAYGDGVQTVTEDKSFNFILQRQPLYIMMNGIFPCLVLNLVILIAFSLPFAQQIGLCMTSFLTYAVTGVRISSDIPVQSEYLPLITLFIFLSILYTFFGLIWFITLNYYSSKKYLPNLLKKFALISRKALFCIFDDNKKVEPEAAKNYVKNQMLPEEMSLENENKIGVDNRNSNSIKVDTVNSKGCAYNETTDMNMVAAAPINNKSIVTFNQESQVISKEMNDKCNFCNRSAQCTKSLQAEKERKISQAEFDMDISALNYTAFFILTIIILCCNVSIWIAIGSV